MRDFIRWLMLANAQRVFIVSIAGLFIISAWWAWRLTRPVEPVHIRNASSPTVLTTSSLGLRDFISGALADAGADVPGNPFMTSDRPWRWKPKNQHSPRSEALPRITALQNLRVSAPPAASNAVLTAMLDPRQPAPQDSQNGVATNAPIAATPYTVRYKGLFILTDGTTKALIQNSASERSAFYRPGDRIDDISVGAIHQNAIDLTLPNGTKVPVPLGEDTPMGER